MKPRPSDIAAVVSFVATLWLSIIFGGIAIESWRQDSLRAGFVGVAATAVLVWALCVTALVWCRWQWKDYLWQRAEQRGLCGRCRTDVRNAPDLCPGCGYPLPRNRTY